MSIFWCSLRFYTFFARKFIFQNFFSNLPYIVAIYDEVSQNHGSSFLICRNSSMLFRSGSVHGVMRRTVMDRLPGPLKLSAVERL